MRALFVMLLGLFAAQIHAEALRLSEPVETGPGYEVFGAPMPDKGPASGLIEVIDAGDDALGKTVRVQARIAEVCQKKGCFLIATEGEHWARVTFKDYAFFVPTDSSGNRVTLEGVFTREQLSAEKAAHYAADLGKPAPDTAEPQYEYSIVASSALIRTE